MAMMDTGALIQNHIRNPGDFDDDMSNCERDDADGGSYIDPTTAMTIGLA